MVLLYFLIIKWIVHKKNKLCLHLPTHAHVMPNVKNEERSPHSVENQRGPVLFGIFFPNRKESHTCLERHENDNRVFLPLIV